jgi:hypothetical protein
MRDGFYSADAHFEYDGRHHNGRFDRYNFANTIDDVHEIVATLIYMGVKGGELIKSESQSETGARRFKKAEMEIMIGAYLKYIESGEMIQETIGRPDVIVAVRWYLRMMGVTDLTRECLRNWTRMMSLRQAIANMRRGSDISSSSSPYTMLQDDQPRKNDDSSNHKDADITSTMR